MAEPVVYVCHICHQPRVSRSVSYPHRGTGCIVVLIGFIFCFVIVGIPVMIYGWVLRGRPREEYLCSSCGFREVRD